MYTPALYKKTPKNKAAIMGKPSSDIADVKDFISMQIYQNNNYVLNLSLADL